jgi:hypothetical protein
MAFHGKERLGHFDMEALEVVIRSSMHQVGGVMLEKLINSDGGDYRGVSVPCSCENEAEFIDYRDKGVVTMLSPVSVKRAYYHCPICRQGQLPKDEDLDIVGTSFSPGVRRMVARVGYKESFGEGSTDLEELAGVSVNAKEVERVSECLGEQIEMEEREKRDLVLCGNVVPIKAVPKMYIAIDGTGVPVVKSETVGRKGKGEDGNAKTREVKLGCVFTQAKVDKKGKPIRDEDSTTYVGSIEPAEEFGHRIYAEAVRRGVNRARQVSVLGDGAVWIWNLADEHFHGAIQIVDLYHVYDHLWGLGKLLYGYNTTKTSSWVKDRRDEIDDGEVEAVVKAMQRLRPNSEDIKEKVSKEIGYFKTNKERMRYKDFKKQGLFVGSGVVEAKACLLVLESLRLDAKL